MRLEEMNTDDLVRVAPHCDTAVLAVGSLSWRPSHLPTGASWYTIRRLRDSLERALGGRVLTLPVLHVANSAQPEALFALSSQALQETFANLLLRLQERLTVRCIVLITDDPALEDILQQVLREGSTPAPSLVSFIWWRDGLGSETRYRASGEAETSLLLSLAGRLVDVSKPSAEVCEAERASANWGQAIIERLEASLRNRLEGAWRAMEDNGSQG